MKFLMRNLWNFALVFILVGAILFGIAWHLGARGGRLSIDDKGLHMEYIDLNHSSNAKIVVNEKNLNEFNSVKIKASSEDVRFIPSDYYGLEICTTKNTDDKPKWGIENGQLNVETARDKGAIHFFDFNFMNFNYNENYIKIYYPKDASFKDIVVNLSSGDINLSKIKSEKLEIEVASGNINADIDKCNVLTVSASSGDIKLSGTSVEKLNMNTTSGNIISEIDDCANIVASASSGDISIKNKRQLPASLNAKATSGSVNVSGEVWNSPKIESSSGDITISGDLKGNSNLEATSGDVKIHLSGTISEYTYDLSASSGTIVLDREKFERQFLSTGVSTSDNLIKVKTSSGDITIEFKK